jgi:putative peptidoglycan lipid II flippase
MSHIVPELEESLTPAALPEPARHGRHLAGGSIAAAAAVLMAGTLLSRVLGLAREQIAAYLFGAGNTIAAFTIADNIHTMLFDLVMSGMMEAALIPVLSQYVAPEQRQELRRITGALLTLILGVVGSALVLMELFAPTVVRGMTALGGGEEARGADTVDLTVQLVRMILPAVFLLAISTVLISTLYTLQRFTRPALSLSLRNVAIVVTTLALGWTSFGVRAMVLGIVIGAVLMVAVQLPGLRDALPIPNTNLGHPAIRRIGRLYLPISLGLLANTAALVVDRNLAWGIGEHALGAMRYATTLNQMVLGLVAAAISLASLPALARYAAEGDEHAYFATLARGLRMVAVLVIPATLGLAALSWPAVRALFEHGATDRAGALRILLALLIYLPGTLFAAFDQVLIFAFYARQNTRTPQIVGVLAIGIYFVFALTLAPLLGMAGLVAANSAQFIFHTLVMIVLLRRLLASAGPAAASFECARLLRTLRVAALVGAGMALAAGALAWALSMGLPNPTDSLGHLLRELLILCLPAALGVALYVGGLLLFRIEEMQQIQTRLLGVVRR